jgi:hypothetical protein
MIMIDEVWPHGPNPFLALAPNADYALITIVWAIAASTAHNAHSGAFSEICKTGALVKVITGSRYGSMMRPRFRPTALTCG